MFDSRATTTDLHRDGSRLEPGAWIYKEVNGKRYPVTITSDNGTAYEYINGHHSLNYSNNRSGLFFNAE